MIWETRVRYVTPPYFWFAIWLSGDTWVHGAEIDVIESFGFDNGNDFTNYDGKYWHSSAVGGKMETIYYSDWIAGMKKYGIQDFETSQYHVWTCVYRVDDTFSCYVDGRAVQNGAIHWTRGGKLDGKPIKEIIVNA